MKYIVTSWGYALRDWLTIAAASSFHYYLERPVKNTGQRHRGVGAPPS